MKNWKWFPDYQLLVNLDNVSIFQISEKEDGTFAINAMFNNGQTLIVHLRDNRESCEELLDEIMGINED